MLKKIILPVLAISSLSADFLGVEVGAALWRPAYSGYVQDGSDSINLEKDLHYGENFNTNYFWAWFDHPLPLIPNAKITHTKLSDKAEGLINRNITYDNKTFVVSEYLKTELTLDQTDFTAYWRILDNWVNLDLGLTIKNIQGNIKIQRSTNTNNVDEDFNWYIPMGYAKGRFDMPFTGLSVEAEINYIGYSGNKLYDARADIVYETSIGLGANIGFRQEKLKLDDGDNKKVDIDISGVFAGIFYHF